ncbi:MAG: T9SS type A sorting domain-containing protein [Chitinophagaceae bacterium]
MIKRILPSLFAIVGLIMVGSSAKAQLNYTVSFPTATYSAITGTSPTLSMAYPPDLAATEGVPETDEGAANGIAFPFPVKFNGTTYNTFNISTNGFISLGAELDTFNVFWGNNLNSGPYNGVANDARNTRPLIAPLWDDLDMQAATNIVYNTSGTAPNRVFTVQWSNAKWSWQATGASVSFQVKFYETTNVIRFHYRPINAGTVTSGSASVGLADGPIGAGNFLSLSALTTTATNSSTTETTTISAKPSANLVIDFTPVATPANDASLKLIAAPLLPSCFSSALTYQYQIRNTGTSPIAPGAAVVNLNVTGANPATFSLSNSKTLAFNDYDTVTFNNVYLNTAGANALTAIVALAGDTRATNDTAKRSTSTATALTTFPLIDSGNLAAFNWINFFYGTNNGWRVASTSYINSALGDSLKSHTGSTFYYFNPVASAALSNSILYTQCLILPNSPGANYFCTFWMSHDSSRPNSSGFGSDSLFITVSTDNGATWNRLAGFDRIRSGFTIPAYAKDSVDLSAYAGQTIHLGLEGLGNYGNVFGIDDITINANVPLPISLTAFTGTREGSKNILTWLTSSETKNKGFELQRSVNGKDFTTITFVNSKSINGAGASYAYADEKPLSGTNYYRLRQIDNDGKSSLSNIVVLKSAQIRADISRVYPNPVQDKLNIVLNVVGTEKVTINITDLVGKTIATKSIDAVNGDNNISFITSQLAKGTYLIKVNSSTNSELATQKFVKQ